MIDIDGRMGEGGGQVLRTSLALAVATGEAFRIENIRAGREKPGLARQHLASVRAAVEISGARVRGDRLGSQDLIFHPGPVRGGDYRFSVGTAGSATLVLQTVLPPLLTAPGPSTLTLEGGTHNPWAPPFDFLERAFLPLVNRTGAKVSVELDRRGFYPAGGGRFRAKIEPAKKLEPLVLMERGNVLEVSATAIVSSLPRDIAERELNAICETLGVSGDKLRVVEEPNPPGPGNAVFVEVRSERVTEIFTAFGRRGVRAEDVAAVAAGEANRYLDSGAPVGGNLADQLALILALSGGSFLTGAPSLHATTNIDVIRRFIRPSVTLAERGELWEISRP